MSAIGVLCALCMIFAAGFGLEILFVKSGRLLALPDLFGAAWLLGSLILSAALFAGGALFSGALLRVITSGICIALALAGAMAFERKHLKIAVPKPQTLLEWMLLGVIAIELVLVFRICFWSVLGWDGLFVWEIKAHIAFLNNGVLPHTYFIDPDRDWTHPDYPLMLPMTQLWLYLWMDAPDQFWMKAIFGIYYLVALCFLYRGIRLLGGPRWLGLAGAAGLCFIPYVLNGAGSLAAGYADFPLATFYLASVVCLLRVAYDSQPGDLLLFALISAGMPWLKREGCILWGSLLLLALVFLGFGKRDRRIGLALLPGALVWGAWKFFLFIYKVPGRPDHGEITIAAFVLHADRLKTIFLKTVASLGDWRHWSLLWIGAAVSVALLLMRARHRRIGLFFALAVFLPVSIYAMTYVFSSWDSYEKHMDASFSRLLLQVAPVALLVLCARRLGVDPFVMPRLPPISDKSRPDPPI